MTPPAPRRPVPRLSTSPSPQSQPRQLLSHRSHTAAYDSLEASTPPPPSPAQVHVRPQMPESLLTPGDLEATGSWGGGGGHVTSEGTPADINRQPAKTSQHRPQSSTAHCAHPRQDARRHTARLLPRPAGLHLRLLLPELPKGRQEGHVRPGAETGMTTAALRAARKGQRPRDGTTVQGLAREVEGEAGFRGSAQQKGGLAWPDKGDQAVGQARTGCRTSGTLSPPEKGCWQEVSLVPGLGAAAGRMGSKAFSAPMGPLLQDQLELQRLCPPST